MRGCASSKPAAYWCCAESTDVHDMLELVVVIFYLMAIVILRLSSDERLNTNLELRAESAARPAKRLR